MTFSVMLSKTSVAVQLVFDSHKEFHSQKVALKINIKFDQLVAPTAVRKNLISGSMPKSCAPLHYTNEMTFSR